MAKESKELITLAYDRITNLLEFVQHMGRQIALSKMFGCDTEAQGQVMALECAVRRMPPLMLAERYHLIFGKLSMKAEAMLADFRGRFGGDYKILERTDDRAAIRLTLKDETQDFAFTWEQAQLEPFIYEGKDKEVVAALARGQKPGLKVKYATPRSRMQMLWSRVVSDAVHVMAPEVGAGRTPEEILDYDELQEQVKAAEASGSSVVRSDISSDTMPAEDVPFEVQPPSTTTKSEIAYCTAEHVKRITDLLITANVSHDEQQKALAKRNVKAWRSLTADQAIELIQKLQGRIEKSKLPETHSAPNNAPASQPQIDQAKAAMKEIAQNGHKDIADRIKAKLKQHGLDVLADLTMAECDQLIQSLRMQNLDLFFTNSLAGHKAAVGAPSGN